MHHCLFVQSDLNYFQIDCCLSCWLFANFDTPGSCEFYIRIPFAKFFLQWIAVYSIHSHEFRNQWLSMALIHFLLGHTVISGDMEGIHIFIRQIFHRCPIKISDWFFSALSLYTLTQHSNPHLAFQTTAMLMTHNSSSPFLAYTLRFHLIMDSSSSPETESKLEDAKYP